MAVDGTWKLGMDELSVKLHVIVTVVCFGDM